MFHLDNISSDDKNNEGKYTIIKGDSDPSIQGNIYNTETSELVSATFSCSSHAQFTTDEEFLNLFSENTYATVGYEGAMVKVQLKEDLLFSNTKRVDCRSSFWGNKEETFYKLWHENGGERFLSKLEPSDLTHHFMIMNSNLVITSRMDMRDHDTIIIYLGSVDLEGNILQMNQIDPEIYHLYTSRDHVLPSKEELGGRILIPTVINPEEALSILKSGYETVQYAEGCIPFSLFKGETVILRRGHKEIIKVTPKCFEMRKVIAGNTPNMKNHLYRLMEMSKDESSYSETFPYIGCLEESQLQIIIDNSKTETSFIINTYMNKNQKFNPKSHQSRMSNILTNCILFCPLRKIDTFINAWIDYNKCKELIVKFIKRHNSDIRHGKYDERLVEYHSKALSRIRNLADVSKIYASEKDSRHSYSSRMGYSLRGLIDKEFGPSLYRIEKAIIFLRE